MSNDLDRLQGTWHIAGLEVEGQQTPAAMLAEARITIKGTRFVSMGMGAVYEGTLHLDPSAKPPALDMRFDKGPEKGNTNLGIYKIDGESWKLCLATRGSVRPMGFASKPGSGFALETLTRSKETAPPKQKTAAAKKSASTPTEFEGEWQMLTGVMNGIPMKASDVQWVKRVTIGNETTVYAGPQVMLKATFTHDSSKTPGTIDYMTKGKTQLGIYEFNGDRLRICMAAPGKPQRPAKFESVAGDGATFTEWTKGIHQ